MNTARRIDSLNRLVVLLVFASSPALAVSSQPSLDAAAVPPLPVVAATGKTLPTTGTTLDADGKILAFSMPVLIEVVHAGSGNIIKVRAVRADSGKGMSMEIVGPIPPAATGTYSGLLPVSLDYN